MIRFVLQVGIIKRQKVVLLLDSNLCCQSLNKLLNSETCSRCAIFDIFCQWS